MTRTSARRTPPVRVAGGAAAARGRYADEALVAALAYAAAGWPVLPLQTPTTDGGCSCGRTECSKPGKHPRTRHGHAQASTDPARITAWWQRWPRANVGVRTGELVVIDVDGPAGARALAALEAAHAPLPATRRAGSARGAHLYFQADGHDIACSVAQLGSGLDVRGRGGYIVAPPSRHATGDHYAWTATDHVAPLPAWLAPLLTATAPQTERAALPRTVVTGNDERARRYLQAATDAELVDVARAPAGTRNSALNRAAFRLGQLTGAGLGDREQLAGALLNAARSAGLGEREAYATIASGLRAGERNPRPLPAATGNSRAA